MMDQLLEEFPNSSMAVIELYKEKKFKYLGEYL